MKDDIIAQLISWGIGLIIVLMLFFISDELKDINKSTHDSKIELEKIRMGMR